jgi:hypothetical protein
VQLDHSPKLLAGTLAGLAWLFLVPPLTGLLGAPAGLAAWGLMSLSFLPMLLRYGRSPLWAPVLPLIACFYMAATLAAARDHHRGRGVVWKDRAYTEQGE